jgi:uncharacterized protein
MDLDPWVIVALCAAALAAGWVDAVSGGGGLLQLPALLIALPSDTPTQALGTNKLSSIFGTAAAARTYMRKVRIDLRTALPMASVAFIGSLIGATLAVRVPGDAFRPIIVALLIVVWVWTLMSPAMGSTTVLRFRGHRHLGIAVAAGFVIGIYDGILGPGTGSFLLIVLVAGLGYSFLQASATAKVVNLGTNLAALLVFGVTGSVLWLLGLLMGLCNVVGAVIGSRAAIRHGSGFVRIVFLVIVGIMILRLSWETFSIA